jgi:hypothetical protein
MQPTNKRTRPARLDKLPIARPYDAISWVDGQGSIRTAAADRHATSLGLEKALPARESKNYPGRPNHPGYYWFAGTKRHVRYESMTEYSALMWFDHTLGIRAISAQPMCLHFRDGTNHFPDFFAVDETGGQLLIDVHPEEFTDDDDMATFSKTESLCDGIGWTYVLFTGINRTLEYNLEWIAGYRHDRYLPPPDITRHVQSFLQEPHTLRDTARWLGAGSTTARIHWLYNLMWHQFVLFDEEQPLSWSTILRCEVPSEEVGREVLE